MKKNILLAFTLSIICTISFAQNGPGGVGQTDLVPVVFPAGHPMAGEPDPSSQAIHGWYKSDDLAAGGLLIWPDQSGNGRDLSQVVTTQQPEVIENQWGGNPLVRFDGTDDFISKLVTGLDIEEDYTLISYWKYTDVTSISGANNSSFFSSTSAGSGDGGNFQIAKTNLGTFRPLAEHGSIVFSSAPYSSITDQNSMMMRRLDNGGTRSVDLSINGQTVASDVIPNGAYRGFGRFKFGVNRNDTRFLSFDMSEFILYDKALNETEEIIVANYLSSKYGGVLTDNKVYDGGDQIPVYNGDVAGIGRVSATDLHTTAKGTGLITIEDIAPITNDRFLMWGHDKKDISSAVEYTGTPGAGAPFTPNNILSREWYISEKTSNGVSANIGQVTIRVDLNKLNTVTDNSDVVLIFDRNPPFDYSGPGSRAYSPTSVAGGIATFSNVGFFADGTRFTIGSLTNTKPIGALSGEGIATTGYEGPGGVGTIDGDELALWLRSDLPSTINNGIGGTTITQWNDLSGNETHVTTNPFISVDPVTGTNITVNPEAPDYAVNTMNGLPVISFDGTDDVDLADGRTDADALVSLGLTASQLPGSDYTFIMVWNSTETNVADYENFDAIFSSSIFNSGVNTFQLGFNNDPITNFKAVAGTSSNISTPAFANIRQNHILSFIRDGGSNNYQHFINNIGGSVDAIGAYLSDFTQFKFGVNRNNGSYTKADLAESIIIKSSISSLERTIINNYLSAKYDIPLAPAQDIYNGDDFGFDFDVAGFGNDGTNTKRDAKGTGVLRFSNPTNLTNNNYFIWGSNVNNTSKAVHTFDRLSAPEDISLSRSNTIWYISENNGEPTSLSNSRNVGGLDLTIDLTNFDFNGADITSDCFKLNLVIDNNRNNIFDNVNSTIPLTINGNQAVAKISGALIRNKSMLALQYQDAIVYANDGTADRWHNAGTSVAPHSDDECFKVIYRSNYNAVDGVETDFNVLSVEVEDGVKVAYPAGSQLTVLNEVNLNTTGDLRLLGNAQLIQKHLTNISNIGTNFYNSLTPTRPVNKYVNSYFSSPVDNGFGNYIIRDAFKDGRIENLSYNYTPKDFIFKDPGATDDSFDGEQNGSTNTTLNNYWIVTSTSEAGGAWIERSPVSYPVPVATGIAIKHPGSDPQQYVFSGRANSGNYTVSLGSDEFYLTGNPFPSDLDTEKFILDNISAITGELYFLEQINTTNSHFTLDYDFSYNTRNLVTSTKGGSRTLTSDDGEVVTTETNLTVLNLPGEDIAMGQGFFIQGDDSGGLVSFKNDQRVFNRVYNATTPAGSFFFKTNTVKQKSEIQSLHIGFGFEFDAGMRYDRDLAISFKNGNKLTEKNKGYDSRIFDLNPSDAYFGVALRSYDADDIARIKDEKLVIAGVEAVHDDLMIPLTVELDEDREVAFTVDQIEGVDRTKIHLYDTVTDEYLPMSGREIKKSLTAGTYTDRFFIAFQNGETLSQSVISERNFSYKVANDKLEVVSSKYEIESMRLVDITGKQVSVDIKGDEMFDVSNLSKGIYIVKINTNEGSTTLKVVI